MKKIKDYITGKDINATPEEIEAVQPFVKQLVEDYGYLKEQIQTHPQFRVKASPSDTKKTYPVDIAVFKDENKKEDELYIVVECKRKSKKDGIEQLKHYLKFSSADFGVWFNGEERIFLKKIVNKKGLFFEEIPNIPKKGQRFEDIGKFKRKDLKPAKNLKLIFKSIRNHLAGNFTGATRDEELAKELINLIFCKLYDEKFTKPEEEVKFRIGINEDLKKVKERVLEIFDNLKKEYESVIEINDKINLDEKAIAYIVGELQNYSLMESSRDAVAEAFESFIGYALKGSQGQFFTPRNIIKLLVRIVNPNEEDKIIDPACGSGGFLIDSLKYIWENIDKKYYYWGLQDIERRKISVASENIKGIEKDRFLSKVAKAYMIIIGDGNSGIFCEDSLENPDNWEGVKDISLNSFDVLMTNPPFGKDIKIVGNEKLKQFELAYQWKKEKDEFVKTDKLRSEMSPQILFIERSLQFLRDGGKLAIILPETFFHAPKTMYVLEFLLKGNNLKWVIDLPHNTFRPFNNAKCLAIVLEKNKQQQEKVNMAVLEEIGHDHQGKEIYRWEDGKITQEVWDDVPLVLDEIENGFKKYCFKIDFNECYNKKIFVPRYFWQNKIKEIEKEAKKKDLTLISINELIEKEIITFFDGDGSPPAEYKGKGDIPYIRVKDIVNWEIYKDPTSMIPENIYRNMKKRKLEEKDILFVRRGSYRIGSVAIVSPFDKEVLLTREILVLRVKKNDFYDISPYYMLYLLSHKLTQVQIKNKVFIETTLPNIGDRWKELLLPYHNDKNKRLEISKKVKNIIESKWKALEELQELKKDGNLIT